MCTVGLHRAVDLVEPLPVRFGVFGEEVNAQHRLEGNLALLKVEAVRPAKIGDPRLGGHARAAEKHGGRGRSDPLRQGRHVVVHEGLLARTTIPGYARGRGTTWEPRPRWRERIRRRSVPGGRLPAPGASLHAANAPSGLMLPVCLWWVHLRVHARAGGERDSRETCRSGSPGVAELCRES